MRTVLIVLSLAFNGLLLVLLVSPNKARSAYRYLRPANPGAESTNPAPKPNRAKVGASFAGPSPSPLGWSALDAGDPRALIARLRETGMPSLLIRSLVETKLERESAAKRAALREANPTPPYWNGLAFVNPKIDLKAAAELRELERRNLTLLDAELGPETGLATRNNPIDRFKYGDLPAGKIRQVKLIDEDYDELSTLVTNGMLGITLPGDREQIARLRAEKEKDMLSVLSPEEYEAYLLRNSTTAGSLRGYVSGFQPTAEEFRTIFRLQRAYDEKYPFVWMANAPGVASPDEFAARAADRTKLAEQIKTALGPMRGVDYERENNAIFYQMNRAVSQVGLSHDLAVQAWTVQKEIDQRVLGLRSDRTIRAADLGVQTNLMRSELTNRLYQILGGQRGLDAYNQTMTIGVVRPQATPSGVP